MIKKQDIAAPRTVQDMERRYKFGKTFAETMGLAKEASQTAERAEETLDSLFAKDIFMTGKFENLSQAFFEPGDEEFNTIQNHILKKELIPAERIHLYDFNSDGVVSPTDLAKAQAAMLGKESLATWTGAVKTAVKLTIDLSNPDKMIKIAGENMWGRAVESYIGINSTSIKRPETEQRIEALSTDYIVEQGTTGIWKYQKWNSGKIELWTESISHTVSYSTISNYLYLSSFTVTVPLVTSVTYANIQETDWHYAQWTTTTRNSTNQITCRYYSANTNGSGKTYTFMAHVIGTWK